jgi:hypothetical protein
MMIDFEDRAPAGPLSPSARTFIAAIGLLATYGWFADGIAIWHLIAGLVG